MSETSVPPRVRNATLDQLSRLTRVADGADQTVESYSLDAEGNRITSHRSNLHVTDPANRLVEDEQHQFEYDVNGNLVRKTVKASSLTWRYGYSVWDELVSVSRHASPTMGAAADLAVTWRYDALGRRAAEERRDGAGAVTGAKTFLHDGEHVAVEADVDGTGLATAPRRFSHTDGTDDIAAITLAAGAGPVSPTAQATGVNAPSAASYYYSTDHQGSVRAVTDDMGTVVNSYSYDSYGNPETAVEALAQPLRYTGREYDAATGLYHYRARAFDPSTGRFLQEDPIWFEAGDLNVYRYTWNNPTNWTDPSGMTGDYAQTAGPITVGLLSGLSINAVRVAVWVQRWNGVRYVRTLKTIGATTNNKSLGCQIGVTLAGIGAMISGATDAAVDSDNCTVVWNTANSNNGPPPIKVEPKDPKRQPSTPGHKPPNIKDPGKNRRPGPGWRKPNPNGAWTRNGPRGKETLSPDLNHPNPIGPHWDWKDPSGYWWRLFY